MTTDEYFEYKWDKWVQYNDAQRIAKERLEYKSLYEQTKQQ